MQVITTLTGLSPGTTYYYRVKAFHYDVDTENVTYGPEEAFTTAAPLCSGKSITGQGSSLQQLAQDSVWDPGFDTSGNKDACNGTQGSKATPSIAYSSTGSGAGLESWGVNKGKASYAASNAFIGTDEPPNLAEKEEIEAHETIKGAAPNSLQTIPVLQAAIALIVHLPANCTATSTAAPGRLVLDNVTLENIWKGAITKWSEIKEDGDELKGASCNSNTEITRVARLDRSGTTHIFKKYLNQINETAFEAENGAHRSWNEIAEGAENTMWPKATRVVRPSSGGGGALVTKVAETPSSIGYANLADARANNGFSKSGLGGVGTAKFWVELQNNGTTTTKPKLEDPSTNFDVEATADANCGSTTYTDGPGNPKFPPPSTSDPWNEVTTNTKEDNYPLCGLTYVLALSKYSAYSGTSDGEANTARGFLQFVTETGAEGGQPLILNHDYEADTAKVDKEAKEGAKAVGY